MSAYLVLRAWEERVIVQEKGNRIVHYILRDSTGNSILAVVGKERSINHMAYTISKDFLHVFGSTSSANAGTVWRARQEVVAWLISVAKMGGQIFAPSSKGNPLVVKHRRPLLALEPTPRRLKVENSCPQPAVMESEQHSPDASKFGSTSIELLSQDSGLRGCWFRCKILHSSQNHLKVQYKDVLEVDGPGKLKEWVRASTVAAADKLGMRRVGRLVVRPQPHENSPGVVKLKVGAAIDAWWCNGWWEGVVIGYEMPSKSNLQVYLPAESRFLTMERWNIRSSRDWIDNKWVEVMGKPDILSYLSLVFSTTMPKLPLLPSSAWGDTHASPNLEILNPHELERSQGDKLKVPASFASGNREAVKEIHLKKRLIIEYNKEMKLRNLSCMDIDGI